MMSATTKRLLVAGTSSLVWAHAACASKQVLDLGGDADGGSHEPQTPIGVLPCGPSVCTSPEVCCQQVTAVAHCALPDQCSDFAAGCFPGSCPAGSLCCGSIQGIDTVTSDGGGHVTGSTKCVPGGTCPDGTGQACEPPIPYTGDGPAPPSPGGCPCHFECSGTVLFFPLFCTFDGIDSGYGCD
jgi:hypothetical protein